MGISGLLPSPLAPYVAELKAFAIVASLGGAFYLGHHQEAKVYEAHLKDDALRTARIEAATQKIATAGATLALAASQKREVEVQRIQTITKTIQQKVPYYVQTPAAAPDGGPQWSLPMGFVWVHNAAARGDDTLLSATPGDPALAAPSGVDLPTAASTIAGNYGLLHECQATVTAWRGWYDQQQALWGKRVDP